jgi:hypothetical protein
MKSEIIWLNFVIEQQKWMLKGTELPKEGKDLGLGFQIRHQHFGVTQT